MIEGQAVSWGGPALDGHAQGDQGQLLAFSGGNSAHVMWSTGARSGSADIVDVEDLTSGHTAMRGLLDDSLEVGGLSTFAVRQVFDAQGEAGVLNAMASVGHLSAFADIAEEAMGMIAQRIRQDPSFREVTASLDDEEGEALIRLASACLIRDAFGSQE